MAIAATYKQGSCTVRLHDDGYVNASSEEIKARIKRMYEVFERVGIATAIRKIEAEQSAKINEVKQE